MTRYKKPRKGIAPAPLVAFNKAVGERDAYRALVTITDEDPRSQKELAELAGKTPRMLQYARGGDAPLSTVVHFLRSLGYGVEIEVKITTPEE